MRRLTLNLAAALAFALALTTVSEAQVNPQQQQMTNASRIGKDASKAFDDKNNAPKANDKAYDAALKNLPDKQYDPWRGVR